MSGCGGGVRGERADGESAKAGGLLQGASVMGRGGGVVFGDTPAAPLDVRRATGRINDMRAPLPVCYVAKHTAENSPVARRGGVGQVSKPAQ